MGASSSREILRESGQSQESRERAFWKLPSFFTSDRLVRDKLCKKVQLDVVNEKEAFDCIPIIQEPPKGIQQEDV